MSWGMQVMHLLRKELAHARYAVLVFVAVVAIGVVHAYGFGGTSGMYGVLMFLLVLFGMALVAYVVQSDSPVRSDAFWPSRPLSPSAVLASKVAMAVLLLAVAFVGQLIGLMALDTSIAGYVPDAAAGLLIFAMWIVLALGLAAVTRNIPNFVLALVALGVGTLVLVNLTLLERWQMPPGVRAGLIIVSIGCLVPLLVELYSRRDPRMARAIGAMLLVTTVLISWPSRSSSRIASYDPPVDGVTVKIDVADSATQAETRDLAIVLSGASRDTALRVALLNAVVSVRTADGGTFDVPFFPYQGVTRFEATTVEVGSGAVVMTDGPQSFPVEVKNGGATTTSLRLTPEQQHKVMTGVKQVRLRGALLVQHPSFIVSVPLAPGATAKAGGYRFRVASLTGKHWPNSVALLTERIRGSRGPAMDSDAFAGMLGVSPLDVVITEKSGKPLFSLQRRNQNSSSSWIVLPGQTVMTDSSIYVIPEASRQALAPSLDSLSRAGASLRIFEWTKRSTFPVDVSGPLH